MRASIPDGYTRTICTLINQSGVKSMANYVLVYKGGSMPESEEAQKEVMAAWTQWFESLGRALIDGGNPFGPSKAVASDGTVSDAAPSELSGYSIVSAESLEAAVALAQECPVRQGGASIEVYETFPVM
jgi:hypothetical protein